MPSVETSRPCRACWRARRGGWRRCTAGPDALHVRVRRRGHTADVLRALLPAVLLFGTALAFHQNAPTKPDPKRTPGDVLTTDKTVICVPGYTKTVRNVPQTLKEQVYRAYGITSHEKGEFEVDHLVSLELGGSNSVLNLWPESYKTMPLNAHVKDTLENKLHDLACSGMISMQAAQQAIATDWEAAYVKYVGPLPGGGSAAPTGTLAPSTPGATPSATAASSAPNPDGSCPSNAPIKVSRSGIFHLPQGDPNYTRTHARACYPNAASAQAAGYRGGR